MTIASDGDSCIAHAHAAAATAGNYGGHCTGVAADCDGLIGGTSPEGDARRTQRGGTGSLGDGEVRRSRTGIVVRRLGYGSADGIGTGISRLRSAIGIIRRRADLIVVGDGTTARVIADTRRGSCAAIGPAAHAHRQG